MVEECVSIENRGEAESGCSNRCHFGKQVKSFLEGLNVFLKTLIVFLSLSEYLVSLYLLDLVSHFSTKC